MNPAEKKADAKASADAVEETSQKSILSEVKIYSDEVEALQQLYDEQRAIREDGFETLEKPRQIGYKLIELRKKQCEMNLEAARRLIPLMDAAAVLSDLVQRIQTLRSANLKSMSEGELEAGVPVAEQVGSSTTMEQENHGFGFLIATIKVLQEEARSISTVLSGSTGEEEENSVDKSPVSKEEKDKSTLWEPLAAPFSPAETDSDRAVLTGLGPASDEEALGLRFKVVG